MLQPGEQIVNMAFVIKAPSLLWLLICGWVYWLQMKPYYAALTNQRLILIRTRNGIFRPKMDNQGVEEYPLANVGQVTIGGLLNNKSINFHWKDGSGKMKIRIAPWAKLCTGQGKFIEDTQNTARALGAGA